MLPVDGDETATKGRDAAAARLGATYARYRPSRRKGRAWSARTRATWRAARSCSTWLEAGSTQLRGSGPILDAGCGGGRLLAALVDRGIVPEGLHGVDLLPDRVRTTRVAAPSATVVVVDARELPFETEAFELVLLFVVASSMRQREDACAVLAEARRCTAPAAACWSTGGGYQTPSTATHAACAARIWTQWACDRGVSAG
jgi:SAM-dependent methyltransferase